MVSKIEWARSWRVWLNGLATSVISGSILLLFTVIGDLGNQIAEGGGDPLPIRTYILAALGGALVGVGYHFKRSPLPDILYVDDEDDPNVDL